MYLNSHAEDRRESTCFTGTLLGLHRQAINGGWSARHYQRIAEAHSDRNETIITDLLTALGIFKILSSKVQMT